MGLNWWTECSIVMEKNKIKKQKLNAGNISSKTVSKRCGVLMEEMKRSSKLQIEDQHTTILVSLSKILAKAISLYGDK